MVVVNRTYGIGRAWLSDFDGSTAAADADGGDPRFAAGYSFTIVEAGWGGNLPFAIDGLPGGGDETRLFEATPLGFAGGGAAARGSARPHAAIGIGAHFAIRIVDIIPGSDSAETDQNSEPSLAVNPLDPQQIIAAAFGAIGSTASTPYFQSLDGGATWADYATLDSVDKSLAWLADGSAFLTALLRLRLGFFTDILTYAGTPTSGGFGSPINTFEPRRVDSLDQPWIRTGPSNHVYVAYNNLNNAGAAGETASVNVSTDGGNTFTPVVIERLPAGGGQDAPAVRLAVNGNTVYAAFTRWTAALDTDSFGEQRFTAQVVVVRSDDGGADGFTALGSGGVGTVVAAPTGSFANTTNAPLTLGQERTGSEMALAVDPNDPGHLVIAYSDAPGPTGSGQLQLIVAESFDSGQSWSSKFLTPTSVRTAQPALAISADGTIGFLYDSYDPATDLLSQHLVQTSDDFATTSDTLLASETNATPTATFSPYLGDFFDLEALGTSFYGVFSASNADNGSNAQFLSGTTFERSFSGTPGSADFQLNDGAGNAVTASIDPFFFAANEIPCFRRGTLILTERGEVPVEELAIGDRLVTLSGAARPIRWIGRRAYDGRFIAGNRSVLPICVRQNALADGVPARDLWLSPRHALYIEGALVQAEHLVNGVTIVQADHVEQVEYLHIELETHDILYAAGAPAESYVDCDNRLMFANAADYRQRYPQDEASTPEFCAERLDWHAEALTDIRAALLDRAAALGHVLVSDPDLRLVADGDVVLPEAIVDGAYRFALPGGGGRAFWLASRHAVPAEVDATSRDVRRLGVPIARLVLSDGGRSAEAPHAYPGLVDGFHTAEAGHRWTDGMARLPEELLRSFRGAFTLEVRLAPSSLRYRPAPRVQVTQASSRPRPARAAIRASIPRLRPNRCSAKITCRTKRKK